MDDEPKSGEIPLEEARLSRWYPAVLTVIFLLAFVIYLFWKAQCPPVAPGAQSSTCHTGILVLMQKTSVADMGQLLSGVAGAVAFIWLVFGYFAQREQLRLQREEMHLTRLEMRAQRAEFATLSSQAERDGFLRYLDVHEKRMATLVADLLWRISNPAEKPELDRAWQSFSNGDQYAFHRILNERLRTGEAAVFTAIKTRWWQGESWLDSLQKDGLELLAEAKRVDQRMFKLCMNTPWATLALMLKHGATDEVKT